MNSEMHVGTGVSGVLPTYRQARYPIWSIRSWIPYLSKVTLRPLGSFRPRLSSLALMRDNHHVV